MCVRACEWCVCEGSNIIITCILSHGLPTIIPYDYRKVLLLKGSHMQNNEKMAIHYTSATLPHHHLYYIGNENAVNVLHMLYTTVQQ